MCTATISRLIEDNRPSDGRPWSATFQVGAVGYHCRAFPLPLPSCPPLPGHTVILLDCVQTGEHASSRLSAEFRLTRREGETIDLLALGLTNKEIAQQMGLSCNTVKAFLHSVTAKLGISTRTGIIGALLARMG
jgi:DNA-binding CsgD family transcriptional regulator